MKLQFATVLSIALLCPCLSSASARFMDTWRRVQITTEELEISAATSSYGEMLTELRIKAKGGRWVSVEDSFLKSVPWPQLHTLEVERFCQGQKCSSNIVLLFSAETDATCTYGNDTSCSRASFEFDGEKIVQFSTHPPYKLLR